MKAIQYYEKYGDKLCNDETYRKALNELFADLSDEIKALIEARNIKFDRGLYSVIREVNDKFNAIMRICKKEHGYAPCKRNGFIYLWCDRMPELKSKFENELKLVGDL